MRRDQVAPEIHEAAVRGGYSGYAHYLQSPSWYALRGLVFKRDNHECQGCGTRERRLTVHHLRYPAILGTERIADLVLLCGRCHSREHVAALHRADD
jgi:5-methylcytosine-specific restriction endonuclease McrA